MRIAKTTDGRYIKVLSPELKGLIGRLYDEIKDRKDADSAHSTIISSHSDSIAMLTSKLDMLLIRYSELSNTLSSMFPEDEDVAKIDKPLVVDFTVESQQFISNITTGPPLIVESSELVNNLNAEMLGGMKAGDFAPASHVGSGGTGVHANATKDASGFMSAEDKKKTDQITIGPTAPTSPVINHIWLDTN